MNENIPVFTVDGELTIYRAVELQAELLPRLNRAGSLALDLGAVTEIDSAGVQLLLSAQRTASAVNGALHIVAQSDAVREVLDTLGIDTAFTCAAAEPVSTSASQR